MAAALSLHMSTPLPDAMAMPISTVNALFECKAFSEWKKIEEAKEKTPSAIVIRLNEVIRGLNIVAKVSNRRKF